MPNEIEEKIQASLDAVFGEKIEQLRLELADRLKSECTAHVGAAVTLARDEAVRTTAISITQALADSGRRIRNKESVTDIAIELVETAQQFCGRCALFIQKGNAVLGFRAQGFGDPKISSTLQQLEIPLAKATAITQAVAVKETVTAGGTDSELSPEVVQLFGVNEQDRIYLIPVVLRDKVLAVLYADKGLQANDVHVAALEVLTTITEAWLEAVGTRKKQHEAVSAR